MTLNSSGPLSLAGSVVGESMEHEFVGTSTAQLAINQLYRGGSLVPNTGTNVNVPTSGQISFLDFYGASASTSTPYSVTMGRLTPGYGGYEEIGYDSQYVIGSISPQYLSGTYLIISMAFSVVTSGVWEFLFRLSGSGTGSNSGWTSITVVDASSNSWTFNRTSLTYSTGTYQTWSAPFPGVNANFVDGNTYTFTLT